MQRGADDTPKTFYDHETGRAIAAGSISPLVRIATMGGAFKRGMIERSLGAPRSELPTSDTEDEMLWPIIGILLLLWLLDLHFHVGGGLIHTILAVAVMIVILQLVTGRRAP